MHNTPHNQQLWAFVVLSLIVGTTFGLVIGQIVNKQAQTIGAAHRFGSSSAIGTPQPVPVNTMQKAISGNNFYAQKTYEKEYDGSYIDQSGHEHNVYKDKDTDEYEMTDCGENSCGMKKMSDDEIADYEQQKTEKEKKAGSFIIDPQTGQPVGQVPDKY